MVLLGHVEKLTPHPTPTLRGRCQDELTPVASSLSPAENPKVLAAHPIFLLSWRNLAPQSLPPVPSPAPDEAVLLSSLASTFPQRLSPS